MVVVACVLMAVFAALAWGVSTGYAPLLSFDQHVLETAVSVRTAAGGQVVTWFTDVGATPISALLATVFVLIAVWRWGEKTPIVMMAAATAVSTSMTRLLKISFERARPDHAFAVPPFEHSFSFPSGHSLNAVVVAGVMAYVLALHTRSARKRLVIIVVAAIYAVLMGLSRMYLGHHWASDVAAGWCVGVVCLVAAIAVERVVRDRRAHDKNARS